MSNARNEIKNVYGRSVVLRPKERLLLCYLRRDARVQLTKASKSTGIPVSTIFDRIESFKASIVPRFTALLDVEKLGYFARAWIMIGVSARERDRLKGFLSVQPCVNNVYRINNGFSFMFEAVFTTVMVLEEFIEEIENKFNVLKKEVYIVLEEIMRENFMSNPVLEEFIIQGSAERNARLDACPNKGQAVKEIQPGHDAAGSAPTRDAWAEDTKTGDARTADVKTGDAAVVDAKAGSAHGWHAPLPESLYADVERRSWNCWKNEKCVLCKENEAYPGLGGKYCLLCDKLSVELPLENMAEDFA